MFISNKAVICRLPIVLRRNWLRSAALALALAAAAPGQTYNIKTFAGGGVEPQGIPATSASLGYVNGVAVDSSGNVYFADAVYSVVLRRDAATGALTRIAGNGQHAFGGDNGPAASAPLSLDGEFLVDLDRSATGIAVDSAGNIYIADPGNSCIRKVSGGVIATVAGNGTRGYSGDNGPATSAQLNFPEGVALDSAGNLYIADTQNGLIRKVSGGEITTVAGGGPYSAALGDNGPATSAYLSQPSGVAVDSAGNLYIADSFNNRIRKVSAGVIATVAGSSAPQGSSLGDNGPAIAAQLAQPFGVAVDSAGNIYIADAGNGRIRKVTSGVINTVAGGGTSLGDNGPATSANLGDPVGIAVDSTGNIFIAGAGEVRGFGGPGSNRVRKVSGGVISTVAGGGYMVGDNGPATSGQLFLPGGATVDSAGNLYIADTYNGLVRKVSNGVITTVAGGGSSLGDNVPATSAYLYAPQTVAADSAGNLYIADVAAVRKVSGGVITTALSKSQLFIGSSIGGLAVDSAGNLYVSVVTAGSVVLKVTNGLIATVAGGGSGAGDNVPATSVQLTSPYGIALDSAGNLYIADAGSGLIRKVSNGVITTVAGGGAGVGDNIPATSARLASPYGVALDSAGNLYIAEAGAALIRKVSNGVITTVAGGGSSLGDNGPATSAQLSYPEGVAVDSAGNVYVADTYNQRIRLLQTAALPAALSTGPAFGAGTSQTFTFTFSDPAGFQNLSVIDVLINSALDGRQACYVAFQPAGPSSGTVLLVNDAGAAGGPFQSLSLPGSGTVSNSQCSISGAGSSVSGSGTGLTLTLAITFNLSFAGNKVVYTAVRDQAANNSGWQALATWNVQTAQLNASLMTDAAGQPGSIMETVPLSGFGGVSSIQSAAFVSDPVLTAGTNYWLVVAPPDLVNDFLGWDRVSPAMGAALALNAQRIGSVPWSTFLGEQGTLRITGTSGAVLFNNFAPGDTYDTTSGWTLGGGAASGNAGYTQGLQFTPTASGPAGTVKIAAFSKAGATVSGPSATGMSPARTSSLGPAAYTFTVTDSNGFQDISVVDVLVNGALDGRHACYVAFVPSGPGSGSVYLVDDAGDAGGPYSGMVLPGSGSVSNSQCSITASGSSVTAGGTTLSLTLAIAFNPSFAGNQIFFLAARSNTLNSNWQAVGTVSVP